jgi:YD repeat-containing protein
VVDYVYDGLNRLRKETQYPNWPSTSTKLVTEFTYDKNGNRITLKSPLLKTTTFGFDPLNRLTNITYNNSATPNVSYTYDLNSNRLSMVDGTGTTTYAYDELDRVVSVTSPGAKSLGYRYDLNGNRVKFIYSDLTAVTYNFDAANHLNSIVDWAGRTETYTYTVDGMPLSLTHNNNTYTEYQYDNVGRLKMIWNKYGENTITKYDYVRDSVGNIRHIDEVLADGGYDPEPITPDRMGTIDFIYDGMYRLVRESRILPSPQDTETRRFQQLAACL